MTSHRPTTRWIATGAFAAAVSLVSVARGQECSPEIVAWVNRCAVRGALDVTAARCAGPLLTIDLATPSGALRVEVAQATEHAFRRVGALGASPVGEFADWDREPGPLRAAFDAVAQCAAAEPALVDAFRGRAPVEGPTLPRRGSARALLGELARGWRLLLASILAAFALSPRLREVAASQRARRSALAIALAVGAAAVLRVVTAPIAFLHQNGQGPLWVGATFEDGGRGFPYGDGYRELFALVAALSPDAPESGVFALSAALGAVAVACAFVIARGASGSAVVAWALSAGVALDPGLSRLSQSESYYGATTSLLFVAAALFAAAATRSVDPLRVRAPLFVAAGLVVVQAARIHPACWPAACLLPLSVLVLPGSRRRALVLTATAALAALGVMATTSGPALYRVLSSPLGDHWAGIAHEGLHEKMAKAAPLALFGAVFLTRRSRLPRAAGVLLVAVAAASATNLVSGQAPWIDGAALRLFAPLLVAASASALRAGMRTRRRTALCAAAALAALSIVALRERPRFVTLPTDVLEAEWARSWRHDVPDGAAVVYLERAGPRVSRLPLYPGSSRSRAVYALSPADEADLRALRGENVYYRSSLCSTREGRDACARFESRFDLREMAKRELPAIPSMRELDYEGPSVQVALFRAVLRR